MIGNLSYFAVGVIVSGAMIAILKIIIKDCTLKTSELIYFAITFVAMGLIYDVTLNNFREIGPLILYFLLPAILATYLHFRNFSTSKAIIFPIIAVFIWFAAELTLWMAFSFIVGFNMNIEFHFLILLLLAMSAVSITMAKCIMHYKMTSTFIYKFAESGQSAVILSMMILLLINFMVISFELIYSNVYFSMATLASIALILTIVLGGGGAVGLILYFRNFENEYRLKQKEQEDEAMLYYINEIEKQSLEIRKFKHDYQNILISLEDYIANGDWDGLDQYFRDKIKVTSKVVLEKDLKVNDLHKVLIREIKSILTFKLMMAKEKGIEVEFEANENVSGININTLELVRIIGILMDNAIETAQDVSGGKIIVGILSEDGSSVLIVENTCVSVGIPKVHELKKSGFSTKGNGRGLGLSNLCEIIAKYDTVFLETSHNDGWFSQKLVIEKQ